MQTQRTWNREDIYATFHRQNLEAPSTVDGSRRGRSATMVFWFSFFSRSTMSMKKECLKEESSGEEARFAHFHCRIHQWWS